MGAEVPATISFVFDRRSNSLREFVRGENENLREFIRDQNGSLRELIRSQREESKQRDEEFKRYQEKRDEEFRGHQEELDRLRVAAEAREEETREFNREILLRNEKVYTRVIAEMEEGRKQIQANTQAVLRVLDRLDGSDGLAA